MAKSVESGKRKTSGTSQSKTRARAKTSSKKIRRIAINTGGGDAPGLNAVIRAIVLSAVNRGWEIVGIRDGYNGLIMPEEYPDGGLIALDRKAVRGITHLGGTILGTTNKGNPLEYPVTGKNGRVYTRDRSGEIIRGFRKHKIDALIAIGGDGSLSACANLIFLNPNRLLFAKSLMSPRTEETAIKQ